MSILSKDCIRLNVKAKDKQDAICQSGKLLVEAGCVSPNYVDGMLAREEIMSTYLGNGVAIPHGQFDNRNDIFNSCISVLQIPEGVEWDEGEQVYLVIGIAALRNEHVTILANLAEAIDDEEIAQKMRTTRNVNVILDHLNKENKSSTE
ncbi:MAG TPA: PTS sugar transporter subunit IIA [Anaerolineaceae bacterium]|jgi:mannitol/fructose-specific phosphotransferase system IIA component|nr:PTS sugar transporter subunit IIA [Anaerolineaceae bacterium]